MARFVVTIKYFLFTACIIYDSAAHATPRTPKISMAPTTTTLAVSIQDRCNVALTAQTAWSWRDAINSPIAPQFQHNFTRAVPLLPSGHETSGYHFFITAEPGTGKTTLVQQLANHWAHTRHGSGGGGLPVYLNLEPIIDQPESQFTATPHDFAQRFLSAILESAQKSPNRLPRRLIRRYRYFTNQPDLMAQIHNAADIPGFIATITQELRRAGLNPLLIVNEGEGLFFGRRQPIENFGGHINPMRPWITGVSSDGLNARFEPGVAVFMQSILPAIWTSPSPGNFAPKDYTPGGLHRGFTRYLYTHNPHAAVHHLHTTPIDRDTLRTYLNTLTQNTSIRVDEPALDRLIEASNGAPIALRAILGELPNAATTITAAHISRAAARARLLVINRAGHWNAPRPRALRYDIGPSPSLPSDLSNTEGTPQGLDWLETINKRWHRWRNIRPSSTEPHQQPPPPESPEGFRYALENVLPEYVSVTNDALATLYAATGGNLERARYVLQRLPSDYLRLTRANLALVLAELPVELGESTPAP